MKYELGSFGSLVISYISFKMQSSGWSRNIVCLEFLFNIQPDAIFIQIYCVIKFYTFRATFLPIIRNLLLYIRRR